MNKILLPALLASLALGARAQSIPSARVPAAVVAGFRAAFPTVTAPKWEKEGKHYEAGFTLRGATISALLSPTGTLLETETGLPPAQLPAPVRARLASTYRAYTVSEAATIRYADGRTVYEAELTRHSQHQDVLFTADGHLVKP